MGVGDCGRNVTDSVAELVWVVWGRCAVAVLSDSEDLDWGVRVLSRLAEQW